VDIGPGRPARPAPFPAAALAVGGHHSETLG
jgi:hypothetical protein